MLTIFIKRQCLDVNNIVIHSVSENVREREYLASSTYYFNIFYCDFSTFPVAGYARLIESK